MRRTLSLLRLVSLALLLVFFISIMFSGSKKVQPRKSGALPLFPASEGFVVGQKHSVLYGQKCVIPVMEPEPSWIPQKPPISCAHFSGLEIARVVEGGLVELNIPDATTCYFKNVIFIDDFGTKLDNPLPAQSGKTSCPSDAFFVSCYNQSAVTYEQLFRCVSKKPQITERVKSPTPPPNSDLPFQDRLNILMFGLDGTSRVGWLEQMTGTVQFLNNNLEGDIFEGYNIIGDGTTAAILGMTTGYFEEELHESRRGFDGAGPIDDFDFVWKRLAKEANYVTLWDEDGAWAGTLQYRLLGFKSPPVDYYGRLFQLTLDKKYPEDACLDKLTTFEEMARQFRHLFDVYPDPIRKFGLVFNSHYSHPPWSGHKGFYQEVFRTDSILLDELTKLQQRGDLNNSAVILFADHGPRYDVSRATVRGKLSERLPFLAIALPKWFRQKYPKQMSHLKEATTRLTTPFDLHATLLDLGGLSRRADLPKRGQSFFQPIPDMRTCKEAGILPHWCSCLTSNENAQVLSLTDPLVKQSLLEFETFVNERLLAEVIASGQCAKIRASQAMSAQRLVVRNEVAQFVKTVDGHGRLPWFNENAKLENNGVSYLLVSFRTEPGGGEFEVTFTHYATNNSVHAHRNQISRTNRYGSAPKCVQDKYPHLRQFCYCI